MDRDVVRLECLKLATAKIPDRQEIMAAAREYETYIVGEEEVVKTKKSGNAKSKASE